MPHRKTPLVAGAGAGAPKTARFNPPIAMVSGRLVAVLGMAAPADQAGIIVEPREPDAEPDLPGPAAHPGSAAIWNALLASRFNTIH